MRSHTTNHRREVKTCIPKRDFDILDRWLNSGQTSDTWASFLRRVIRIEAMLKSTDEELSALLTSGDW